MTENIFYNYYELASLDLSAAFDLVNRNLLFERLKIMGIPDDIITLLKDWLSDRKFYVNIIVNQPLIGNQFKLFKIHPKDAIKFETQNCPYLETGLFPFNVLSFVI